MSKAYVKTAENRHAYDQEAIEALRKQARAWRIAALIATHETPEVASVMVRQLFFKTMPFVNGPAVDQFIAEHEARAEECGILSGVFTPSKGPQS